MVKKSQATVNRTLLQKIGLFFHDKKETTIVFWLAILVFGIASYTTLMQRQGFPNVDVPVSIISGTYFVGNKSTVDEKITKPISEALASIDQVESISTQAGDFYYSIVIRYKDGVTSEYGNALVKSYLDENKILPNGASQEFQAINAGRFEEQSDMLVSVTSDPDASAEVLQAKAQLVAKELSDANGVQKVTVLEQVKQGIDPETGSAKKEIIRFDRLGMRDGSGAIIFYPSVTIGIQSKPSTDALELYDTVTEKIESLRRNATLTDTRVNISADFAEGIRSQIAGLQQSLFEGLIVVILVSCLLISFRAGIVTALSMTTVLLATISILYASGITLNTITLFGLILSLGLIVDDTTIMVEAIDAAKNTKKDQRTIVSLAIKKVARASFAGTLTTMLAFSPMLFISGILGDFIRILPITIITALFASLLVSLTLVPFLARFLLGKKQYTNLKNPVLIAESYVSTKLSNAVAAGAMSRKKRYLYGGASVLFSTVLFISSVPLFAKLKFDIFPNTKDSDAISVTLRYKDGTSLETAAAIADKANTIIGDNLGKNIKRVTYENTGTPSTATARIDLVNYKDREQKSPEFISKLQEAFKDFGLASVKVGQIDVGPPKDDFPFTVRIVDSNIEKASRLALDMREQLLGKTVTRANGTTATIIRAEVSHSDTLRRDNGNAYVSVSAGFDASDTSALVGATEKIVKDTYTSTKLAPYNITRDQLVFDFGNESNNQDSFKSMLIAFPVLLLFMYILLALQFRSFLQPLLIFMAIPFSFFGVAAGLYVTNNPLSFFVMIGFFALIGIAVNNTILLTDYANQARDEGSNAYEAMALAIKARFRPLVTTSLTSVVALLPLALSDPFWESLSYTLIFGLLSSTLLVVVGFPYYYLIGEWLRVIGSKVWKREMPRWLQIPFDILISPIRVVRFLSWVVFSWRS